MADSITAHVNGIKRQHHLCMVIFDLIKDSEFTFNGFRGSKQVAYLQIEAFVLLLSNEVYLQITDTSDSDFVVSAEKLQIDDVLKNQIDIPGFASEHCFPYAMVCNIEFIIDREHAFALNIKLFHLIEEKSIHTVTQVIEDGFPRNRSALTFEKSGY